MTAVEWLIEQLKQSKHYQKMINEVNQSSTEIRDVIGEAKKMEKEQIIQAYYQNGWNDNDNEHNAEQYYNQTFKKD